MSDWTFITNHAAVLIAINHHEMITTRELAIELGITERSVIRLINDLEIGGYIAKHRVGRSNHYETKRDAALRREALRDIAVGDLLDVLTPESRSL